MVKDEMPMMEELIKRIERLEYHQQLLYEMVNRNKDTFTSLIVRKNLDENEVQEFYKLCDCLNKKLQQQKAEGFVHFHPLLEEFTQHLNKKLVVPETIDVCLKDQLYSELMEELKKYI